MPAILKVQLPDYALAETTDWEALGKPVDDLILAHFPDRKLVLRAIGLQDHPGKDLREITELIIEHGTDRYDPQRASLFDEDFASYQFDFHGVRCNTHGGILRSAHNDVCDSVTGEFFYDFFHHAKLDRGYSVKLDVLLIYDAMALTGPVVEDEISRNSWEDYLFKFKEPRRASKSLLGIVQLTQ